MLQETKTFIARVHEYKPSATSPALDATLASTVDSLKNPSCATSVDADQLELLEFLLKVMLVIPGPPCTNDAADDTLGILIDGLKKVEKNAAKHTLCDILADVEIHVWDDADGIWGVDWGNVLCWMVALLELVEGWGVGYQQLMGIVREFPEDLEYEDGLRGAVMQAYRIRGLAVMGGVSGGANGLEK